MEYANLSVAEIQRQLEETESKQEQLKRLLETRRQEGKDEVAQQVKDIILGNGYDLEEIINRILPGTKRRRGAGGARKLVGNRQYRRYVDPDNVQNVYVRGVLPGWMKQKMKEQGYDPASKDDREAFKSNSLRVVEG